MLILARQFVPLVGGTERQAQRLAAALARQGASVTVLTAHLDAASPRRECIEGCEVLRLRVPRTRVLGTLVWMATVFVAILARARRLDVIHVFWAKETAVAALVAGRLTGVPVIVRPAGGGHFGEVGVARRSPFRRAVLATLRRADAFVALSSTLREELAAVGVPRSRIHVIPNGIPIRPAPAWTTRPCRAIFVGRLSEEKNLERLLDAWKRVVAERPHAELRIVGDGPLRSTLEARAARLGIADSVAFLGHVDDVGACLAEARVFVQPSISEGMSAALVEALAAGLPVVVTPTSGALDLVEEGRSGTFVPRDDSGQIAAALVDLLSDEKKARAWGEHARAVACQRCDVERVAERHLALYGELSDHRRATRGMPGVLMVIATLDNAGAENQMAMLAAGLAERGVPVRVACLTRLGPLAPRLRAAGVEVDLLRKRGKVDVRAFGRLFAAVRHAPGVTHTWLFTSNTYGRLAARLARSKGVVASERSLDPWKRRCHCLLDRALGAMTDRIVTNACAVKDVLVSRGIDDARIDVIPNAKATGDPDGVAARALRARFSPRRETVVGYVGRLSREKGADLLIEAFGRVAEALPGVRLVIVGDGEERATLEERVSGASWRDRVTFVGELSDVTDVYPAFDIFVLPSRYEGLPNAVIEAGAAGCAVVAADVGGVREIVRDGETGTIVPSENVDALRGALRTLVEDEALRRRLGERAKEEFARRFSHDAMVDAYVGVYESVLGEAICRK